MNWKIVDSEMTCWRTKIKDLQIERGIGNSEGCFDCEHWENCYASICEKNKVKKNKVSKGEWTYVGHQYGEALVNGKKAKILFVSMLKQIWDENKLKKGEDFESVQKGFRTGALKPSTPHMDGVDVELKYLLDEGTSCEDRCQQFALTNAVRCCFRLEETSYHATCMMEKNCASHTKAIIQALEPDIIIAQGTNPRNSLCKLFDPCIVKKYKKPKEASVEIGLGKGILFLLTPHPAYYSRKGFQWSQGYLPDELKKPFKRAREIYAGTVDSEKNVEGAMAIKEFINTFELCGDRPEALNRRVILLLNELANEKKLEVVDKKYPCYLKRPHKIAERVMMEVEAKNLRITLAPADTVTQAREFFCKVDKEDFLSLEESSAWTVRPNLHFSFARTLLIWAETTWKTRKYFDYFSDGYRSLYGQKCRDKLSTLAEQWMDKGLIDKQARDEIKAEFNNTKRKTLNVVPGFSVSLEWDLDTVIQWEKSGELETQIANALATLLETWGEEL